MLKIIANHEQGIDMEDLINTEYKNYVLEDDNNLDKNAKELKQAWGIVIERMKLYGVLVEKVEEEEQ